MSKLALLLDGSYSKRQSLSLLLSSLGLDSVIVHNLACLKDENFFEEQVDIGVGIVFLNINLEKKGLDLREIVKQAKKCKLFVVLLGGNFPSGLDFLVDGFLLEPLERQIVQKLIFSLDKTKFLV